MHCEHIVTVTVIDKIFGQYKKIWGPIWLTRSPSISPIMHLQPEHFNPPPLLYVRTLKWRILSEPIKSGPDDGPIFEYFDRVASFQIWEIQWLNTGKVIIRVCVKYNLAICVKVLALYNMMAPNRAVSCKGGGAKKGAENGILFDFMSSQKQPRKCWQHWCVLVSWQKSNLILFGTFSLNILRWCVGK